jgi:ribonuclease P protein component
VPAFPDRFRRSDRLLHSRDFRRVSRTGRRVASASFVILVAASRREGTPSSRLGTTVSRKVGNAVVRNRVKRAIREWFRQHRSQLPPAIDMVVIARPPAAALSGQEISTDLCEQLQVESPQRPVLGPS